MSHLYSQKTSDGKIHSISNLTEFIFALDFNKALYILLQLDTYFTQRYSGMLQVK
jgi:hypothetical protein